MRYEIRNVMPTICEINRQRASIKYRTFFTPRYAFYAYVYVCALNKWVSITAAMSLVFWKMDSVSGANLTSESKKLFDQSFLSNLAFRIELIRWKRLWVGVILFQE